MSLPFFEIFAGIAIAFLALMMFLALFEPGLRFKVSNLPSVPLHSEEFHANAWRPHQRDDSYE